MKLKEKETEVDSLTVEKDREIAALQKRLEDVSTSIAYTNISLASMCARTGKKKHTNTRMCDAF